jgi:hypothetical protein
MRKDTWLRLVTRRLIFVTRNVVLDRSGKINFLTRLYKKEEFEKMKRIISAELASR